MGHFCGRAGTGSAPTRRLRDGIDGRGCALALAADALTICHIAFGVIPSPHTFSGVHPAKNRSIATGGRSTVLGCTVYAISVETPYRRAPKPPTQCDRRANRKVTRTPYFGPILAWGNTDAGSDRNQYLRPERIIDTTPAKQLKRITRQHARLRHVCSQKLILLRRCATPRQ